jgi:hypothetical protein
MGCASRVWGALAGHQRPESHRGLRAPATPIPVTSRGGKAVFWDPHDGILPPNWAPLAVGLQGRLWLWKKSK